MIRYTTSFEKKKELEEKKCEITLCDKSKTLGYQNK